MVSLLTNNESRDSVEETHFERLVSAGEDAKKSYLSQQCTEQYLKKGHNAKQT